MSTMLNSKSTMLITFNPCRIAYTVQKFNFDVLNELICMLLKMAMKVPPQNPYFLKNGQINRVTKVSSTFGPTESDYEKKLGGYLDSRRGNWI